MNKEIEEIARIIDDKDMSMCCWRSCDNCSQIEEKYKTSRWFCQRLKLAEALYKAGYRKCINDNGVNVFDTWRAVLIDNSIEISRLKEEKQQAIKEFAEKLKLKFDEYYNLSLAEGCIMLNDLLKEYNIGE